MGNRRNRRSRNLETPSPETEVDETRVETPNAGNITLTKVNSENQENIGECNSDLQLNIE